MKQIASGNGFYKAHILPYKSYRHTRDPCKILLKTDLYADADNAAVYALTTSHRSDRLRHVSEGRLSGR